MYKCRQIANRMKPDMPENYKLNIAFILGLRMICRCVTSIKICKNRIHILLLQPGHVNIIKVS